VSFYSATSLRLSPPLHGGESDITRALDRHRSREPFQSVHPLAP
jgi:hypothetical protein